MKDTFDFYQDYYFRELNRRNEINSSLYRQELKAYYSADPFLPDNSEEEFEQYLIEQMMKYTGANQKNNKRKTKFSYNCEKHLIIALIAIIVGLPFYYVNYWLKPEKKIIFNAKVVPPGTLQIMQNSK